MWRDRILVSEMKTAFAMILLAGASSADPFQVPNGCAAYLTVQDRNCSVDHHFICNSDPSGTQRRVSFDEKGMTYAGLIDSQTQWLTSFHIRSGHTEKLSSNPADPASLDELIDVGQDNYNFETNSEEFGRTRYVGFDRLTGKTIEIDGIQLEQTYFEITATSNSGDEIWRSAGNEFVNREWRIFLSGTSTVETSQGKFERDATPVEFTFPGEPGFLSSKPKHGCGVMMSSAAHTQEIANDNL